MHAGYLDLLLQLTVVEPVSLAEWQSASLQQPVGLMLCPTAMPHRFVRILMMLNEFS